MFYSAACVTVHELEASHRLTRGRLCGQVMLVHLEKKGGLDLGLKLHTHKNPKVNAIFIFDINKSGQAMKSKKLKVADQILEVWLTHTHTYTTHSHRLPATIGRGNIQLGSLFGNHAH